MLITFQLLTNEVHRFIFHCFWPTVSDRVKLDIFYVSIFFQDASRLGPWLLVLGLRTICLLWVIIYLVISSYCHQYSLPKLILPLLKFSPVFLTFISHLPFIFSCFYIAVFCDLLIFFINQHHCLFSIRNLQFWQQLLILHWYKFYCKILPSDEPLGVGWNR